MKSLYSSADLYDLIHLEPWKGEVEFYTRQATECGPRVLELACGTGRVTLPLAERGLQMTGLDISEEMLTRARVKSVAAGVNIRWVQGDMRAFALGAEFDLIFIPINSLCHLLTRADAEACLRCVRQHLAPRGRFVIDVFNPDLKILARHPQHWYPVNTYPLPNGGHMHLSEQTQYDRATQINHIVWRFEFSDAPTQDRALAMRQYFPQELDMLLAYNGLAVLAKYGKYGEKAFHAESNQQLVVAGHAP